MQWDLGIKGLGLLVAMSLGFGLVARVMRRRRDRRSVPRRDGMARSGR